MMEETEAKNYGICCILCQERLIDPCVICGEYFEDGDSIICENHRYMDSKHYHKRCKVVDFILDLQKKNVNKETPN